MNKSYIHIFFSSVDRKTKIEFLIIIIIFFYIIINNFIKIFLKKPVYKSSHILLSSTKILLQIKIITRTFEYLYNCYNQSFKF